MAEERQNNATVNPPNFDRLAEGLRMAADGFLVTQITSERYRRQFRESLEP